MRLLPRLRRRPYREAEALRVLLAEVNRKAPRRSKASDGWIGDAAHAARDSDHNPWVVDSRGRGVVRARDFTHDPRGGLDCNQLADFLAGLLRAGTHPALGPGAYVIWNRRIISRDRIAEGWRHYSGSNAHTKHLHLSVARAAAGFDSRAAWGWLIATAAAPAVVRRLARLAPARWSRFLHFSRDYRRANSRQGIMLAAKREGDARAIDLDAQPSAEGLFVNAHWPSLGREGYRYTAESVAAGIPASKLGKVSRRRVSSLPWAVLRTLETADGYRLQTIGSALLLAAQHGVRVEVEPKFTPTEAQLRRLALKAAQAYGADWRDRVQLKRLATIPGWEATLRRAKRAGFRTILLRRRPDAEQSRYIDFYRK